MLRTRVPLATLRTLWYAPPRGVALVEFGLAAPFIILLLVGLVDFGMGFYQGLQVRGAASAGAEYATLHAWDTAAITQAVQQATNLGTNITLVSGYPTQVCGCTDTPVDSFTNLGPAIGQTSTVLGSCTSYAGSCTSPPGLYASVKAQLSYSPMMPYPWATTPLILQGQAYRRLK